VYFIVFLNYFFEKLLISIKPLVQYELFAPNLISPDDDLCGHYIQKSIDIGEVAFEMKLEDQQT